MSSNMLLWFIVEDIVGGDVIPEGFKFDGGFI